MKVDGVVSRTYKGYEIKSIQVKKRIGSRRWYTVGYHIFKGEQRVHGEAYYRDVKRWVDERVREQQAVSAAGDIPLDKR